MKVCIGGTFNILHKGHVVLFEHAFKHGSHVFIGLTSDELVRENKEVELEKFETRKDNLEIYLNRMGWEGKYSIVRLEDELGPAVNKDFDAIVVSEETREGAEKINREREKNSLLPLKILTVKMVHAENGEVISATKIKRREMDENGRILRTMSINVGSENKVKIKAVKNVFSRIFEDIRVKAIGIQPDVPKQPKGKEVVEGAKERAKRAMDDESDFGVGIEAGLLWNDDVRKFFDVQFCAVIDRRGRMTFGHGGGFYYPTEIINLVEQGKTVGESMEKKYGLKDVGKKKGAIGFLSKDILDRTKLTEQAVLMALIPRIRRELYE